MSTQKPCQIVGCESCPTRSLGLFAEASPEGLRRLSAARLTRRYSPGQTLFEQGSVPSGIHCIARGQVKLYKLTESGNVQILGWAGPGETLGEAEFCSSLPHGATAEAGDEVETCFIEGNALRSVLDHELPVSRELVSRLSSRLLKTQDRLVSSSHKPVRARIAELLIARNNSPEGPSMNRKEMSQLLGITPETLARILTEFHHQGLIEKDRRSIEIPDPERLRAWAEAL